MYCCLIFAEKLILFICGRGKRKFELGRAEFCQYEGGRMRSTAKLKATYLEFLYFWTSHLVGPRRRGVWMICVSCGRGESLDLIPPGDNVPFALARPFALPFCGFWLCSSDLKKETVESTPVSLAGTERLERETNGNLLTAVAAVIWLVDVVAGSPPAEVDEALVVVGREGMGPDAI